MKIKFSKYLMAKGTYLEQIMAEYRIGVCF